MYLNFLHLGLRFSSALIIAAASFLLTPALAIAPSDEANITVDKVTFRLETYGPVKFDEPNQPVPIIANGTDYTFKVTFMDGANYAVIKNVDYNVIVLENGKETYNLAEHFSNSSNYSLNNVTTSSVRTTNGNSTLLFRVHDTGGVVIRVTAFSLNSAKISPESADFPFQVAEPRYVPEFSALPIISIVMTVGISSSIALFRYRKAGQ